MPRNPKPTGQRLEERVEVRLTRGEKEAFASAAAEDGISTLSEWLRWLARTRMKSQEREGRPTA